MLSSKFIRENLELVERNLIKRNSDISLDNFKVFETERLRLIRTSEDKKSERNKSSKEIGRLIKEQSSEVEEMKAKVRTLGDEISQIDHELNTVQAKIDEVCYSLPNLLDDVVPYGKNEEDNQLVREVGKPKTHDFEVKDHVDLLEAKGWVDFERAAKVTGARFSLLKGEVVKLERALINFLLDHNLAIGYTEVNPPVVVNNYSLLGTGQLPKFEEDLFVLEHNQHVESDDKNQRKFYLIPTAEVPLTNLHRDEIMNSGDLPLKYTAYTQCFRSEAGSAGRDTRGLIRLHQFGKVELVNYTTAEESDKALEAMVEQVEKLLQLLELPYRVMLLCSSDIGFSARKCYDLEVWLPSQAAYREVSSCSNCGDFQAVRANIRHRDGDNSPEFVHTLNGSALPLGRTLVALLENHQEADGRIKIPVALVPYFGKEYLG